MRSITFPIARYFLAKRSVAACVAAITVVYCLIVPVLLLVPKELTAYADE